MPEVRIMTVEPLHAGKDCEIILKVTNPTQHLTSIQFRPLLLLDDNKGAISKSKTINDALKEQPLPAPKVHLYLMYFIIYLICPIVYPDLWFCFFLSYTCCFKDCRE